tara:strand:- start:612 stop:716 length:105 start_codon:yes stop_codon:yes gene_type:complete
MKKAYNRKENQNEQSSNIVSQIKELKKSFNEVKI